MPQNGVVKRCSQNATTAISVTVGSRVHHPKYQIGQWVQVGLGKYGKIIGISWQAGLPRLHQGYWQGEYHEPGFEYQIQEQGDLTDWMGFQDFQEERLRAVTDLQLQADLEQERLALLQEVSLRPFRYFIPD